VEALHDMIRYCEMMADPGTHMSEADPPKKKEFGEKYTEAYWKIRKVTDIGAFVSRTLPRSIPGFSELVAVVNNSTTVFSAQRKVSELKDGLAAL
jgi:hypothetical protein